MKWMLWGGLAAVLAIGGFLVVGVPLLEPMIPSAAPPVTSPAPRSVGLKDTDVPALRQSVAKTSRVWPDGNSVPLPRDPVDFQYLSLELRPQDAAVVGHHLAGLLRGVAHTMVLVARVTLDDGRGFPSLPILVLERRNAGAGYDSLFPAASGFQGLMPLTAVRDSGTATITLSVHLFEGEDPETARRMAETAARVLALLPPGDRLARAEELSAFQGESEAFMEGLSTPASLVIEPLTAWTLPFDQPDTPSLHQATFADRDGSPVATFDLRLTAQPSLLTEQPDPLSLVADGQHPIGQLLHEERDLTAYALHATGADLELACDSLSGVMSDRLGLSPVDAALALRPLMAARAALGDDVQACAEAPETVPVRASTVEDRNRVLNGLAALLRGGATGTAAKLFADPIRLRDLSGIWLNDKLPGVLGNAAARLHMAAERGEAAQSLAALSVRRMACYHRTDTGGAALLQLADTGELMVLDAVLRPDGKVSGLSLGPVGQGRYCRAIAGGDCYFATTETRFANVDRGRCR
ncbi:hypothetical protein JCM17960_09960 [Magnetospira thiophila]